MYTVEWLESALDELTRIWTGADSSTRKLITQAAATIDQRLRDDPFGQSESREGDVRILFAAPLGINFRPEADGQTMTVAHVWLVRPARQS